VRVEEADPASSEVAELLQALDADLARRYPGEPIFGIDAPTFKAAGGVFLVLRDARASLGCGAYRPHAPGVAEIKRMFVTPSARGRGYSRLMLRALEERARGAGYSELLLETGERQPEAIALYISSGYRQVARFGEYVDNASSVCFAKVLLPGTP
jgi:GNAT superfamily N-acetyltransferase